MRTIMENTSLCVGKFQVLMTAWKDKLYSQVAELGRRVLPVRTARH